MYITEATRYDLQAYTFLFLAAGVLYQHKALRRWRLPLSYAQNVVWSASIRHEPFISLLTHPVGQCESRQAVYLFLHRVAGSVSRAKRVPNTLYLSRTVSVPISRGTVSSALLFALEHRDGVLLD